MKLKLCIAFIVLVCLMLLALPVSAVYVPPPQTTAVWAAPPMDCPNATPLNPGEYYLVDEYVYIYSSSGGDYSTIRCALVYMDWGGNCIVVPTPLSNYFFKRLPDIGGKYIKSEGSNTFFNMYPDFVLVT